METVSKARSDIGLKREANEDAYRADSGLGLYVVCDGMGGQAGGEVASRLATDAIHQHYAHLAGADDKAMIGVYDQAFLPQTNWLASALRYANQVVHQEAQQRPECRGMGTTAVCALLQGSVLSVAHVGDSGLYLLRGERILPLTADHTLVAEQVRAGVLTEDQARWSERKHLLTRALGVGPTADVELGEVPLQTQDVLVLCSDGLTRWLQPADIHRAVRAAGDLDSASQRLIELANAAGGDDNTTVIVVEVREAARWGLLRRILRPFSRAAAAHTTA